MKFKSSLVVSMILAVLAGAGATAQKTVDAVLNGTGLWLGSDPRERAGTLIEGEALARLSWQADAPAFPGDRPGSLTALYDARLAPGRFGVPLAEIWDQDDTFTAAAVFVIEPEGFRADPNGFFEISWGLWNTAQTGMNRTGDFSDFATDSFELLEFAWFPNVSDLFGGPFLSPALFGEADEASPLFPFLGGFANFAFGSEAATLPLGEPLMAVLEHRPEADAVVVSVHRVIQGGRVVPIPGAVSVIDLTTLPRRMYSFDALGLTLWQDGFSGEPSSLYARVTFHRLVAVPGRVERLESLLHLPPAARP